MGRSDRSRDQLVRTMQRLLRQQGWAATGMAQVTAEGGVSTSSAYHHFPGGKEDLAREAIETSANEIRELLRTVLADGRPLADQVETWMDLLRQGLSADDRDGCPIAPTAIESVAVGGPLRAASTAAFAGWHEELVERLRQDGHSRRDSDALGWALLALIEGALLLARTSGNPAPLAAVAAAARNLVEPVGT